MAGSTMPTVATAREQKRERQAARVRVSPRGEVRLGAQGLEKLSERVYRALKREIVMAVLRPGEALTEKYLAERYKSSRTPVREAALRLVDQNLLRVIPNCGYFVCHLTVKDLSDIYEYRAVIECASAELAAARGMSNWEFAELKRWGSYRGRGGSRTSFESFIAADTAFHIGIARLTQNALLVKAVSDMRCQMERILFGAIDALDPNYYYGDLPVRGHQVILDSIKRGDAKLARECMYDHITSAKSEVIQLIANGSRLF